jgi:pimeloyl-ACP methyl ester carboxylesterase
MTTEPRRVEIPGDGVTLAADAHGNESDPPVIFLHGGGQTRHSWANTAQQLGASGWYALTVDLRGHGDSSWSPVGSYDIDQFASDARAAMDFVGRRPAMVGASLGGMSSLLAVAEAGAGGTDIARALILVDITPRIEVQGAQRIGEFMRSGIDGFASLEDAADAIAAYNPARPRPTNLAGLHKNLRLRDGRWYWHYDPAFLSPMRDGRSERAYSSHHRMLSAAATIKIPTLLVRGKLSDIVSDEGVEELRTAIPHAQYVNVEGAGHMVAGDRNDPFNQAVTGFLDGVRD